MNQVKLHSPEISSLLSLFVFTFCLFVCFLHRIDFWVGQSIPWTRFVPLSWHCCQLLCPSRAAWEGARNPQKAEGARPGGWHWPHYVSQGFLSPERAPCSCPTFGCSSHAPRAGPALCGKGGELSAGSLLWSPLLSCLHSCFARIVRGRNKQLREQIGLFFFF